GPSGLFADGARQGIHPLYRLSGPAAPQGKLWETMLAPSAKSRHWTKRGVALWHAVWDGGARLLADLAPKGLYARALIIIIAPIVLLESVVAFTFMERHWNQVTRRLSEATARNIGALVDLYVARAYKDEGRLADLAQKRFGLTLTVMEPGDLPKG